MPKVSTPDSPPHTKVDETLTDMVCTTSYVTYPLGACLVYSETNPRSFMVHASNPLKNWLKLMGVTMDPAPCFNLSFKGAGSEECTWAAFLENWDRSSGGLAEWRTRLEQPEKYGSYANNRIFFSFSCIKSTVRNLVSGAVERLIENIFTMAEQNDVTDMPTDFSAGDALDDFKAGKINKIISLAVAAGGSEDYIVDLMDDLMLPYFHVVNGPRTNSAGQKVPAQGWFVWYEYKFGRGFTSHIAGGHGEASRIRSMDMDDIDATVGTDY